MRPRLSVFGICQDEVKPEVTDMAKFNWADAVCDSAIMAGVTFFTTLAGAGVAGVPEAKLMLASLVSAGASFFSILAMKRKLIKDGAEK